MADNEDEIIVYEKEKGLKLLQHLGLLSSSTVEYVLDHFESTADGSDLLEATGFFYYSAIPQLHEIGEVIFKKAPVDRNRKAEYDGAVKGREIKEKLAGGMTMDEILKNEDVSKYLPEDS